MQCAAADEDVQNGGQIEVRRLCEGRIMRRADCPPGGQREDEARVDDAALQREVLDLAPRRSEAEAVKRGQRSNAVKRRRSGQTPPGRVPCRAQGAGAGGCVGLWRP